MNLVQLLPAIRHEERSDISDSPELKRRGPGDVEQLRRGERRPHRKAGWEEVQEVSASFDTAVRMLDFETDYQDFPDESLISRPGGYRVRLYAVGRDSGVECQELDDGLVERYFLQLWPDSDVRAATPVRRIGA